MDDLRRGSQRSHKSLFSPWLLIICIRQGIWAFQKAPCLTRQICASTCENPALGFRMSFVIVLCLSHQTSYCHLSGFVVLKALFKSCWRTSNNGKQMFFFWGDLDWVLCGVHKESATLAIPNHSDLVRYEEKNLDSVKSLEKGLIANYLPASIAVEVITCIYARGWILIQDFKLCVAELECLQRQWTLWCLDTFNIREYKIHWCYLTTWRLKDRQIDWL